MTLTDYFIAYFVAFGVMIGGCIMGGIGALFIGQPPLNWMDTLAKSLKIWAIVAAIGGTFETITAIERGLFEGSQRDMLQHFLYISSAFFGAHSGSVIIRWFIGGDAS